MPGKHTKRMTKPKMKSAPKTSGSKKSTKSKGYGKYSKSY